MAASTSATSEIDIGERSVTALGSVRLATLEGELQRRGLRLLFEAVDTALSVEDAIRLGIDVRGTDTLTCAVLSLEIRTIAGIDIVTGPTSPAELRTILASDGPRADLYRNLDRVRDRHERAIRTIGRDFTERGGRSSLRELLSSRGFDVARSLVGTIDLVTIVSATFAIAPTLPYQTLIVLGFPDIFTAGDNVSFVKTHEPLAIDAIDDRRVRDRRWQSSLEGSVADILPGGARLLVRFGGTTQRDVDERATGLIEAYAHRDERPATASFPVASSDAEQAAGCAETIWLDSVCDPNMIGHYLRDFQRLAAHNGYDATYGGHLGRGRIHALFDFHGDTPDTKRYRTFALALAKVAHRFGATISLRDVALDQRDELREIVYGEKLLGAIREFREAWGVTTPFEQLAEPRTQRLEDVAQRRA